MKNQESRPAIEDDSSDIFPCDIVENILSRLPVKSLLRFRSVCKSWNAEIKSSGFAKIHFNQFNTSNSQNFFLTSSTSDGTYSLIKYENHEFEVRSVVEFPAKIFESAELLCCCEGIILFKGSSSRTCDKYLLLNPFTRDYSSICFRSDWIDHVPSRISYGLCFDKYEDNYKVVLLLPEDGFQYFVYSVKHDWWISKERLDLRGHVIPIRGTHIEGVVYWNVYEDASFSKIIYFDPEYDLIKILDKPGDSEPGKCFVFLENYRGNLCYYTYDLEDEIGIWLLRECGGSKCWMKLTKEGSPATDLILVPDIQLYVTRENEVELGGEGFGWTHAVYDFQKQKFVGVEEFPALSKLIVLTCLESLNFPARPTQFF